MFIRYKNLDTASIVHSRPKQWRNCLLARMRTIHQRSAPSENAGTIGPAPNVYQEPQTKPAIGQSRAWTRVCATIAADRHGGQCPGAGDTSIQIVKERASKQGRTLFQVAQVAQLSKLLKSSEQLDLLRLA
jgi:hypothetical protein